MNFLKNRAKKTTKYYAKKDRGLLPEGKGTILSDDAPFFVKEAYKALRTNIIFSLPIDECKKIAVTSALAGEGKSTNCLNLAISFAQMGSKTIIVDADLRRPNISKLLDKKASPGLSNVLVGLSSLDEVICKTKFDNLDTIFSGDIPPNPTELLISDRMNEMLDKLSENYDYIFIDCPPINVVTDASIISKYVSGMIMVVRQGETTKDDVLEAKNQLDFAGAKIIGTILNDAGESGAAYKYKNYKYLKKYKKYKKGYYAREYAEYVSEPDKEVFEKAEKTQKEENKKGEKKDKKSAKEKK